MNVLNKSEIKIAEITLKVLIKINWNKLQIVQVKKLSKIKSFEKIIKNKNDLLNNINLYFDYRLSLKKKYIEKSTYKDMIFETIMMRFDILQDHRKAIISIFKSFKSRPKDLLSFFPSLLNSIILMVNYTGISTKGILGQMKIKGVLIIYISTFFVWIKDETGSLDKTMISLDENLDRAGKILNFIKK